MGQPLLFIFIDKCNILPKIFITRSNVRTFNVQEIIYKVKTLHRSMINFTFDTLIIIRLILNLCVGAKSLSSENIPHTLTSLQQVTNTPLSSVCQAVIKCLRRTHSISGFSYSISYFRTHV